MPSLLLQQAPLLGIPSNNKKFFFFGRRERLSSDDRTNMDQDDEEGGNSVGYVLGDDRSHESHGSSDSDSLTNQITVTGFRSRANGKHRPTNNDMGETLPLMTLASSDSEDSSVPSTRPVASKRRSSSTSNALLCGAFRLLQWAVVAALLTCMMYYSIPLILSQQYAPTRGTMFPNGLEPYTSVPNFHYSSADQTEAGVSFSPVHIPRIVHVTYKSRAQLPAEWEESLQIWKTMHPQWEIRFWSDEDIAEFVHNEYPEMEELWKSYKYMIQRVDSVRYMILYRFGGLYSDMDIFPATSLDKLLEQWEDAGKNVLLAESLNNGVTNAFMAAAPGSAFMKCAVDNLLNYQHLWTHFSGWQHWEVLSSAGSTYLWGMVGHCHDEGVEIMDKRSFRACSVCDAWETGQPPVSCDTRWLHHSTTNSSWHQNASLINRILFNGSYFFFCKPFRGCFMSVVVFLTLVRWYRYRRGAPS